MRAVFSQIAEVISEIFFPLVCVNCRSRGANLCVACIQTMTPVLAHTCPLCNRLQPTDKACTKCRKKISLDGLTHALRPNDEIRNAVHNFKYRGIKDLRVELGVILSRRIKKEERKFDLILPVPASGRRLYERGYNQTELLAKEISREIGIPAGYALKKIKNTSAQVGLSREDRLKNLAGAFRITKNVSGKKILLIDDVATTLSTLSECAKTLKLAGAESVWGLVLYKD